MVLNAVNFSLNKLCANSLRTLTNNLQTNNINLIYFLKHAKFLVIFGRSFFMLGIFIKNNRR